MSRASCLCGDVTWELKPPYAFMSHCHCGRCRKTHGTLFATYVGAPADGFHMDDAGGVTRWESTPGSYRSFCGRCGSVTPIGATDGLAFAPVGNFDDDPGERPAAHIFVASKAPWFEITDDLPRFDTYPAGIEVPDLPDRPPLDPPGRPRGSCLCGEVAFVVEGPVLRAAHCHCGRCRKARSAAHASNLVTDAGGVRFTRGADQMSSYKIPEARTFTQVFCRTCGSCMPRIDRERDIAVVPLGSLDDDPKLARQYHIFVGSKAPWFEINDDFPRHLEGPPSA